MNPSPLIFPILVLIGYLTPAILLIRKRSWRAPDTGLITAGVGIAVVWILSSIPTGLKELLPAIDWGRLAPYFFLLLSLLYLEFTRAFLQHTRPSIFNWSLGVFTGIVFVIFEIGWIPLPAFVWMLGAVEISNLTLFPILQQTAPAIFTLMAWGIVLIEYARRRSPLHRNRMLYWMLGTIIMFVGAIWIRDRNWALGIWVNWLGTILIVYTVVNPHLTDLATGARRTIRHILSVLIPIAITLGLSSGAVYLIGSSQIYPLRLTTDAFFSMALTGVLLFVFYQPLSQLTRRTLNRVLFGQRYEVEAVVREYSQAVNQVISLEGLTAAAMGIIQKALGAQRGTMLVIDDEDERGWYLRVLPGLGVPFGEPRLFLRKNSPLAQWFSERNEPLHQYFLDVDQRFEEQNSREMQEWRQLNMEVFLPVRRSDAMIGLIALGLRRSNRAYTTPELNLLQTLADQTGVALENATLFDGVQQRADQLALLNDIGRVITTSLDLEPTLQLVAKRIENAFKGMAGFIFLMDETRQELALHTVFGTKRTLTSALRVGPGRGLVGWVAEHGQAALAHDLQADSRYDSQVEGFLVPKGRAAVGVPVRALGQRTQNQTIGVILLVDPSRTSLGPAELSLLDSIASFASVAIENTRQVAAREEMLRRQVESLRIEVDELKREQQVDEIVETEFFQDLRIRASQLRRRNPPPPEEKPE